MTAAELYEQDAGFRGFMQVWCDQRRCPLELTDYLLDRDMVSQAECCRWMHEGEAFESWQGTFPGVVEEPKGKCTGRFPWYTKHPPVWLFRLHADPNTIGYQRAHRIPTAFVKGAHNQDIEGTTAVECILKVMDAWNPEAVQ